MTAIRSCRVFTSVQAFNQDSPWAASPVGAKRNCASYESAARVDAWKSLANALSIRRVIRFRLTRISVTIAAISWLFRAPRGIRRVFPRRAVA